MDSNKISQKELLTLLAKVSKQIDALKSKYQEEYINQDKFYSNPPYNTYSNKSVYPSSYKYLQKLIGTIPILLLDERIFERNQEIADFASKLGIKIPSPEKKKREDIIGRIIVAISKFDRNKLYELDKIIFQLIVTAKPGNKNSFFANWDKAIKKMKI